MCGLHFSLENLPPHLRSQAERQLGLSVPAERAPAPAVFAVPGSTPPPEAAQKPRRRSGGVLKANTRQNPTDAPQALPAASPSGFASIAEARAQKKAVKRRKTLTPDMAATLVKSCKTSPDGDEVRFILGCSPYMLPTAQEKKIAMIGSRPRLYKAPKVQKAEKTLTLALAPHAHLFSSWGDETPRGVWVDFCYEYPVSTSKKDLLDFRYSVQKSDLDNLEKGLQDSLTAARLWKDDSLISELHLRKFRILTDPFIMITIRKLPQTLPGTDLLSTPKTWFFKDIAEREENPNGMS